MPRIIFYHLLLLIVLAGCSGPQPPAWTLNPGDSYPPAAYLTGVGFDRGRIGAENQARAEIAKIFQVTIHALVSSSEAQSQSRVGALAVSGYSQDARSELTATTDKALSGVRIAEVWAHPETGEHYALAVLDRLAAARPLRGELNDIDLAVTEQVRLAEEATSPTRQLGHYLTALKALERRRVLAADLHILEPSGWVADPPHTAGTLAARADRAASQIRIGIELSGDHGDIVKGSLVRALAEVGMKLAPEFDRNLTIRGAVDTERYATDDSWQWSVASAQIDLLEGEGTLLDTLRSTVREGSRQPDRSDTVARENLGRKLAALLIATLGALDQGR